MRVRRGVNAVMDVSKAYDRVWRESLWKKMQKYGVVDKFVRVCKTLYKEVEASVLLEESSRAAPCCPY